MAGKIVAGTLEHSTAGSVTTDYVVNGSAKLRCRYNQATASLESGDLNVSSISDDSTGNFTVSITSAMNDALYSVSGYGGEHGNTNDATFLTKKSTQSDYSTTAVPVACFHFGGSHKDSERDSVIVFGDLA